jgi:hypothetical protein
MFSGGDWVAKSAMMARKPLANLDPQTKQALGLWGVFIVLMIIINGTVPFAFGIDVHEWTYSPIKDIVVSFVVYSGLFLVAPLVLTKGWATVYQPAFFIPLLAAITAITLRTFARPTATLAVVVLAYLHWRFNLSELGIRSHGWQGDVVAILLLGLLPLIPRLLQPSPVSFAPIKALLASLDRLFANPASTTENLFYFGFLTERLARTTGKWLTPLIVGLMYTAHEMSNPEYWYEGSPFVLVFIGVAIIAAIYLWRRNVVAIWLGDGLGRFFSSLF